MAKMIKVIELRKVINAYLKTIHPNVVVDGESKSRVFFQKASDDAVFPYLVYNLPNSADDGSMDRFILDIDGWDVSTDTTAIETIMDSVDKGLHRKTVMIGTEISATFYRENRIPLTDEDKRISRRKYIYQIRTHE
jgi:hypothetical protein